MADSTIDEVADGIYRISSRLRGAVGPHDITVNVFLVMADEPLLFHSGLRACFGATSRAIARLMPLDRLRWLSFGHVEADECGAMNPLLAAAPRLVVAYGELGCWMSVADLADRPPRALAAGEALDLGGRRVRMIPTPHVPHNLEAQVLFEETTGTLLCGDLCTELGAGPAVTPSFPVAEILRAEDVLGISPPGEAVPEVLERLASLEPRALAVMHGSSFEGDGGRALRELAVAWRDRVPLPTGGSLVPGRLAG